MPSKPPIKQGEHLCSLAGSCYNASQVRVSTSERSAPTMSTLDRPLSQRELRALLDREFPDLDLHDWYKQYRALKASSPDAVLLYRMGDFYEAFDDDAKLAADL